MRRRGRYERYVATNDVSGNFYVTGQDEYGGRVEGKARLRVCKNCLRMLDYRNYTRNRKQVFQVFEWSEFFDTYRPHFARIPTRRAGMFDGAYAPNWDLVSKRYKEKHAFMCENCHVNLKEHPRLLHVHHINGVKTNDAGSNLKALCANCHGKQPGHGHMRVPIEDADPHLRLAAASASRKYEPSSILTLQKYCNLLDCPPCGQSDPLARFQ